MADQNKRVTRKIKKFDFSDEKATVSLVGPSVGGAANGYVTLLTKSNKAVSEEFLEKASKVTVTMPIEEYLSKFFGLYWDDAELLARVLGFTTEHQEWQEEYANKESEPYVSWIDEKVKSISVMKSLHEADSIAESLSNLSEEEYLTFLQEQQLVEKALKKAEKPTKKSKPVVKATEVDEPQIASEVNGGVTSPVVKQQSKEKSMTVETQVIEQEVEVIAKAQFDEIQKAFETQKQELQKALDLVKAFEQEKKQAIAKARLDALKNAVKNDETAEVIFKSVKEDIEDTAFQAVVKALSDMQVAVEKSALFEEQGATVEEKVEVKESEVAKILKAKYINQNKQ